MDVHQAARPAPVRRRRRAGAEALISTLAAHFGLTARAIRHYEQYGLVSSYRDANNRRNFDARARDRLRMIAELRAAGLSLREVAPVLDLDVAGREAQLARAVEILKARLEALEADRLKLRQTLDRFEGETARPAPPTRKLALVDSRRGAGGPP